MLPKSRQQTPPRPFLRTATRRGAAAASFPEVHESQATEAKGRRRRGKRGFSGAPFLFSLSCSDRLVPQGARKHVIRVLLSAIIFASTKGIDAMADDSIIVCPYCGQSTSVSLGRCTHCSTELAPIPRSMDDIKSQSTHSHTESATFAQYEKKSSPINLGWLLLGIPVGAGILVLMDAPVGGIVFLMGLCCAIVAAIECSRFPKSRGALNSMIWFLAMSVLWPIAYPSYLYQRRRGGLPSRFIAGLIAMGIFFAAAGYSSIFDDQSR